MVTSCMQISSTSPTNIFETWMKVGKIREPSGLDEIHLWNNNRKLMLKAFFRLYHFELIMTSDPKRVFGTNFFTFCVATGNALYAVHYFQHFRDKPLYFRVSSLETVNIKMLLPVKGRPRSHDCISHLTVTRNLVFYALWSCLSKCKCFRFLCIASSSESSRYLNFYRGKVVHNGQKHLEICRYLA